MDFRKHITADPNVCHGKACVRGTRVMVTVVLDNLAEGQSIEQVARAFHITEDDVRACLAYAAGVLNERVLSLPDAA